MTYDSEWVDWLGWVQAQVVPEPEFAGELALAGVEPARWVPPILGDVPGPWLVLAGLQQVVAGWGPCWQLCWRQRAVGRGATGGK